MHPAHAKTDLVELVIPCLNEEAALPATHGIAPVRVLVANRDLRRQGAR